MDAVMVLIRLLLRCACCALLHLEAEALTCACQDGAVGKILSDLRVIAEERQRGEIEVNEDYPFTKACKRSDSKSVCELPSDVGPLTSGYCFSFHNTYNKTTRKGCVGITENIPGGVDLFNEFNDGVEYDSRIRLCNNANVCNSAGSLTIAGVYAKARVLQLLIVLCRVFRNL